MNDNPEGKMNKAGKQSRLLDYCRTCGQECHITAKVCMNCGRKNPTWSFLAKSVCVFIMVALCLAVYMGVGD